MWLFKCDCGREKVRCLGTVKSYDHERLTNCGCTVGRRSKYGKGGVNSMTEYHIYRSMLARCYNPNQKHYVSYGGRGIIVCDRWRESFERFLEDVGLRPSIKHSIDRINNDGNYEPGNVRWATREQQSNNKRTNLMFDIDGKRQSLSLWAREFHRPMYLVWQRIKRGWELKRALTEPV